MNFTFTLEKYSNGTDHYVFRSGDTVIGVVDIVEGGYLARGRRKPVATLKEAGLQLLDSWMNKSMKEHEEWHRLFKVFQQWEGNRP